MPLSRPLPLWFLSFVGLAVAACAPPAAEPAPAGTPSEAPALAGVSTQVLAAKLVRSAAVKEGDIVLVTGGVQDWALLEDLAVEIRRAGAWPLTTPLSETLTRRLVDEVPPRFDSQRPARDLALAGIADVTISIDFVQSDLLLAHVEPERVAAQTAAFRPVNDLLFERGVRQVSLGNGLLPTPAAANRFGLTQEALAELYWAGVNTDYEALQARAAAVAAVLSSGQRVRITTPHGTDLTMDIAGQRAIASDGVISDDDIAAGGGALSVYLPAGEAFVAPVPGTAQGRIVVDRLYFQGREVLQLEITVAGGRVTGMTAAAGMEPLQALYAASDEQKDRITAIDIGLNPDVVVPEGSRLRTWVPAGMVTIGIGNNLWASGSNSSSFFLPIFLAAATLEVDGTALVDDGRLVR